MRDVFISYSTADRQQAQTLAEDLKRSGFSVWWDRELSGGESGQDVAGPALSGAKAVIVIWSESSVRSQWVKGEARHAESQQKLIPTKIAGLREADIPSGFRALPTEPVEDRDRILCAVERLIGRSSQSSAAGAGAREPARAARAENPAGRAEGKKFRSEGQWPISPTTFIFALVIVGLLTGWSGIPPTVLLAGVIGAFVGAAILEETGWKLDVPRAAAAMAAGAIIAAILAKLAGLV